MVHNRRRGILLTVENGHSRGVLRRWLTGLFTPPAQRVPSSWTRASAWCAFLLGLASAVVTSYWAAGGRALLDTVGGSIERWGRERSAPVVFALVAVALLKLVVAGAALLATRAVNAPTWTAGRVPRLLSWVAAVTLVFYGGILTGAGLLVQGGVADPGIYANRHALGWHTWFWDPWFLLWGIAFVVALWHTTRPAVDRPNEVSGTTWVRDAELTEH